ncbi:sugar transferase [Synechocystis salina]|uniref:Sugar transferase n=2 Tax=Synechocystis TaxID=1142 RepID=A0ABR9VSM2_9SYNC|nr:sugar transferase [Synechocystis salina]MBE9240753.1 sugar transferase [Synechocystis salina LEGE 00041]MBE9254327.1 sugar transferase [Synechocystis salina LEGE 00031]
MASAVQLIEMPALFGQAEVVALHDQLRNWLHQEINVEAQLQRVIFDFAKTQGLDSSAIIYLRRLGRWAQARGIEIMGWSVGPKVQTLFQQAGIDEYLTLPAITNQVIAPEEKLALEVHPSVQSKAKRLMDMVGAVMGLGITALLFVPLAIAIKLDSPGPVLYSQLRCGYRGKQFRIWKFRSMVVNADDLKQKVENQIEGAFFKNENDPRITKLGHFLRKTSLDEFPQFFNILLGEMSLVGTRPPTLDEVDQYEIHHGERLEVKPGLTGEWQVNGRSSISNFEEVVALDLQYQQKWSIWHDLKLLVKTITVVFSKHSGAC